MHPASLLVLVLIFLVAACGGPSARPPTAAPPQQQPAPPPDRATPPAPPPAASAPSHPSWTAAKYEEALDPKSHACLVKQIEGFCSEHSCATFDESWDLKERSFRNTCKKDESPFSEMGRCGKGHYIRSNGGFSGATYYFDGKGKLVAVHESADYDAYCDHQASVMEYGTTPSCTEQPIQKLCQRPSL